LTKNRCWSKVGYPDLSNMAYLGRFTMMFLSCFPHFLHELFGLQLGLGLRFGIGLVLGDRVRVRFEVRLRSIVFICATVIENINRKWLPCGCGILALCCNF